MPVEPAFCLAGLGGRRARLHAGSGVGRRPPGASHATPRAVTEVRVVTTGDEISLNYHSVGLGSAACHAAAGWAGACSDPVAVAAAAPLPGSGRGSWGASQPLPDDPRGKRQNYF